MRAKVTVPGSKSMTNRALVLAALSDGPSTVSGALVARDTALMTAALRRLGVAIAADGTTIRVTPGPLTGPAAIDCGLAGTVLRFLPPAAALATGRVDFDGEPRARERPVAGLLEALRTVGVAVDEGARGLPFGLTGTGSVPGGAVRIDASASSQFVSALLLAGARYDRGVDIRHEGPPVPSLPHIAMTVAMLRAHGAVVAADDPGHWSVEPGPLVATDVTVEPDLTTAAPFLAAAVVTGGTVAVQGWPAVTDQAGDRLRSLLAAFGATVARAGDALEVSGSAEVRAVDLDLHDVGELTPVVAALAATAEGPSYLRGIGHLRGHETDRLAALSTELGRLGCSVRETADGLEIRPGPLHGARISSHGDHRIAQAAAVLGLVVPGIEVDDVDAVGKTHPDFTGDWAAMLG